MAYNKYLRILAISLLFGIVCIGCDSGVTSGPFRDTPSGSNRLSGTYIYDDDPYLSITFNGNNFIMRDSEPGYEMTIRGTYTVSGSTLALNSLGVTYFWLIVNSTTLRDDYYDYWRKR